MKMKMKTEVGVWVFIYFYFLFFLVLSLLRCEKKKLWARVFCFWFELHGKDYIRNPSFCYSINIFIYIYIYIYQGFESFDTFHSGYNTYAHLIISNCYFKLRIVSALPSLMVVGPIP